MCYGCIYLFNFVVVLTSLGRHVCDHRTPKINGLIVSCLDVFTHRKTFTSQTSFVCRRRTRATRRVTVSVMYTQVGAQCDKLATVGGQSKLTTLATVEMPFRQFKVQSLLTVGLDRLLFPEIDTLFYAS